MMSDENATPEHEVELEDGQDAAARSDAEDRLALLEAENSDLRDKLLRAAAEMDNLRKRTEREVNDTRSYAIAGFARDMLVATDNLSSASGSGAGARLGPPLATPTMAGRKMRSPMAYPACITCTTVPSGTLVSGTSNIA